MGTQSPLWVFPALCFSHLSPDHTALSPSGGESVSPLDCKLWEGRTWLSQSPLGPHYCLAQSQTD